jgi:nucleoside-diphosphate-sugar epimerase
VGRAEVSAVSTCSVTGATSPVGDQLVDKLLAAGYVVHAIGRGKATPDLGPSCVWHQHDLYRTSAFPQFSARVLFHIASIWLLPDRIEQFHANGVQRVIALSSTSRFSKANSSSPAEQAVAESLARAEDSVASTCERLGIAYTILRPTLIYGVGQDRNVADIARFAERFGVFPILGEGRGLRQPVHAADLAQACMLAVDASATFNRIYNLSGGETLTYREMVERVFQALGKPARIVPIPKPLFRLAIQFARQIPAYRHLKPEMAKRMDQDLCFDHLAAERDFGYLPRPFLLDQQALGLK